MGPGQLNALRTAFERMIDLDTAATSLSKMQIFCAKADSFSSPLTQKMMVDGKTSPGMHLLQLYFIATGLLTLKLMLFSHHFWLHGGKCLVTRHFHFRSLQ
jgi:hypothetical protein